MKGQAWTTDFMFAMLIFSIAVVLYLTYSIQPNNFSINKDFERFSSYVLSDGLPENWNETDMIYPGILSNGVINSTKFSMMKNMNETKISSSYGITSEFYVNVTKRDGTISDIDGPAEFGKYPSTASFVLKKSRISSFGGEPVIVNIVVWRW